jgi:hypothetical protein
MTKIATFDLETDGLLDEVETVWCGVVMDHATGDSSEYGPNDIMELIHHLDSYDVLIGHNSIAFDFPVLRKLYGWEYHGKKVDTLLMSRTQRPNRKSPKESTSGPHSVESWGIRLGGRKIQNEVWDHYHPKILERCKQDVHIQYRLLKALLKEGRGEDWREAHILNAKLFHYLQLQEEYGWRVDRERIIHNIAQLNRWIGKIDSALADKLPLVREILETKKDGEYNYVRKPFKKDGTYSKYCGEYLANYPDDTNVSISGPFARVGFRPVDLDKQKEVKDYLLELGWKPEQYNYNDAGDRTSAKLSKNDHFHGIQGGLGKLIAKRVQCKHRIGTLEGWIKLIREDGRISAKVNGIAATGRLRHKDIVNVPSPHSGSFFAKQMRQVFITRPGWVLVGVDSKGNQVRQLAARMGDEAFTEAALFGTKEAGTDIHAFNQKRSGAPSRSQAKNFFYGFIFGAGPATIASTIKISVKKAKELMKNYFDEMPLLKKCVDELTKQWQETAQKWYQDGRWIYKNGKIEGLDGRPIMVDSEHKILCYALQSDEAIQMGRAYVKFHEEAEANGYERGKVWGAVIWMHDEIQFECHPDIADDLGRMACDAITEAGEYYNIACPHEGEYDIGENWYETH